MVERVNCTLKSKLYRYFTGVDSLRYIDVLQDIVDSYNNTYHRSIGHAPAIVSLHNVGQVRRKLYGKIERTRTPIVYEVRDLLERLIEGVFYEKQLQKVKRPDKKKSIEEMNKK